MRFQCGPYDSDDLEQDVALLLWEKGIDPTKNPALAEKVRHDRACDLRRREGRRPHGPLSDDAAFLIAPTWEGDPVAIAQRGEDTRRLRQHIASLPSSPRRIMQLRCQGISFEQAALQLCQKISSVRSADQRGLAILRARLSASKTSGLLTAAQNRELSSRRQRRGKSSMN